MNLQLFSFDKIYFRPDSVSHWGTWSLQRGSNWCWQIQDIFGFFVLFRLYKEFNFKLLTTSSFYSVIAWNFIFTTKNFRPKISRKLCQKKNSFISSFENKFCVFNCWLCDESVLRCETHKKSSLVLFIVMFSFSMSSLAPSSVVRVKKVRWAYSA